MPATGTAKAFEKAKEVPCPVCGSKAGEQCRRITGELRDKPHVDRRLSAIAKER